MHTCVNKDSRKDSDVEQVHAPHGDKKKLLLQYLGNLMVSKGSLNTALNRIDGWTL